MDDDDLAGLIERVKAGDDDAIRELIHRFEGEVRTIVRVRLPQSLRSQFDSMDFVQAVWQSVLTKDGQDLGQFTNARHFRGFLAGVARNKVFEEHRRRTRTRKYSLKREEPLYVRRGDRELPREVPATDPTPSQDAQARDRFAQLIEGRSPQEAEVVELRRRGLTFEEIAAQTGLSERSVRRIIEVIRQRMEARQWR
jgi:RNA polymerase sigma-70 factor (ECF subfamily)